MADKFRVVFIGAGNRCNQVILPAFNSLEDVEIAAICDIDMQRLNDAAEKYGVSGRYGQNGVYDYQRMLDEVRPDAVVAVGQPHTMYDIWMYCLDKGYDLFIEKPMGINVHQARALNYMAEKKNCITQVAFQRRATPMVVELRNECLKRGPIVHAVCRFYKCEPNPFLLARDHMMDDTVHSIDTLRWICGGEVVKIESCARRINTPDINFISATLHFDNGSMGYLINSWTSGKRIFSVEMHAPGIFVEAEHEGNGYLYADGNLEPVVYNTAKSAGSDEFYVYTGVKAKAREFVDCCIARKEPSSCFSDALKTMEVADKILAKALLEEN